MPGQGRLGDKAKVMADAHGCPGCPHPGIGPAIIGSPDVFVNKMPALRVDDVGIHAACCGPNQWKASEGSASVFINGKPAHRNGDPTQHCGGRGKLIEGSTNVFVGDARTSGGPARFIAFRLVDTAGHPVPEVAYRLTAPNGSIFEGKLDADGWARVDGIEPGKCKLRFPQLCREEA